MSGVRSYEAAIHQEVVFGRVFQGVWKSPVTSRLLLEANYADVYAHVPQNESPGITPDIMSAMDIGTGIMFRAANNYSIYYREFRESRESCSQGVQGGQGVINQFLPDLPDLPVEISSISQISL